MNLHTFLQTVPEFSEMTNEELDTLERAMVVRDHPDGETILCQNHGATDLYLIMQGEVEILHERQNARGYQVIKTMGPGELVGLHSLISHRPTRVCCRTRGETKLATLPRNAFDLLFQSNSLLTHHFQRIVARQLAHDYSQVLGVLKQIMFASDEGEAAEALQRHIDTPAQADTDAS
ncbi:MAG: cyclic nucleotide-binding domain-containing protein [Granulosicoccaceae bacterium]|jgi:CRP-like cAMP-binding protein